MYTSQIMDLSQNQLEFGNIRSQIEPNNACFSGEGDGHYYDCGNTPTSCENQNLFTCTTDQVSSSQTKITYSGNQPGDHLDQCICFGKSVGGLSCTNSFELTFACYYN